MVLAVISAGCAELDNEAPARGTVNLACTNDGLAQTISLMGWELSVELEPGETPRRGEPFDAVLSGTAVLSEELIGTLRERFDLKEVNLVDVFATVHVRSGATGQMQTLTLPETIIPYLCFEDRTVVCNPRNDDDQAGEPGRRPNSDCQSESALNPCGRFVAVPESGDLRVDFDPVLARYTVKSEASVTDVLFGWDDVNTGARKVTDERGRDVWELPPAVFEDEPGSNSIRADFSPGRELTRTSTIAFECTMGVDTNNPDFEGPTSGSASPSPPDKLIAIPVQ